MRWFRRSTTPAAPVAAQAKPALNIHPIISDGQLVPRAAQYPVKRALTVPAVSERVIPAKAKMAVDSDINQIYSGYGPDALAEGLGWLGYPYLAELSQRPEYRRAAEILSKEMTRKWVKLTSTADAEGGADDAVKDRIGRIEEKLAEFNVQRLFQQAVEHDGYYGRGQLYIDTGATDNDAELRMPLPRRAEKVRKGKFRGLVLIDPTWTYPNVYNAINPLRDDFFRPETWFVMGKQVHRDRILFFVSRPVPDLLKPAYAFGGLALTQMMKPYVDNWLRTRQSVSDLLHSFSVMVLKTNMAQIIYDAGSTSQLLNRLQMFNLNRDNQGTFAIDKETEDFANISAPIAGLHELQAQSQEHMSAVTGIPLVKLLGITPTGLNASSEGEIRTFYDWVHAQQEADLSPHLRTVIDLIQLSEFGDIDKSITFQWQPLWDADEVQASTVRSNDANTAATYINAGVLSPEEERDRLARQEDGLYNGLRADDLPEPDDNEDPDEREDAEAASGADA